MSTMDNSGQSLSGGKKVDGVGNPFKRGPDTGKSPFSRLSFRIRQQLEKKEKKKAKKKLKEEKEKGDFTSLVTTAAKENAKSRRRNSDESLDAGLLGKASCILDEEEEEEDRNNQSSIFHRSALNTSKFEYSGVSSFGESMNFNTKEAKAASFQNSSSTSFRVKNDSMHNSDYDDSRKPKKKSQSSTLAFNSRASLRNVKDELDGSATRLKRLSEIEGLNSMIDHSISNQKKYKSTGFWRLFCGRIEESPIRLIAGKIVTDQRFLNFVVFLILLNAAIMGITTALLLEEDDATILQVMRLSDQFFLIFFTVELGLHILYQGFAFVKDGWLMFDLFSVGLSWYKEEVRVLRCFRLIARLDILRGLVLTVIHVMPRIYSILCLFTLVLYVFAVMCTILFGDLHERGLTTDGYFSNLAASAFTLFQMVTLEWSDVVRQVCEEYYWAWGIFSPFLTISGFILYSLVVAVVCDSFLVVESEYRRQNKLILSKKEQEQEWLRMLEEEEAHAAREAREDSMRESHEFMDNMNFDTSGEFKELPRGFGMTKISEGIEASQRDHSSAFSNPEHLEHPEQIKEEYPVNESNSSVRSAQERMDDLQEKLNRLGEQQQSVLSSLQKLLEDMDNDQGNPDVTPDVAGPTYFL